MKYLVYIPLVIIWVLYETIEGLPGCLTSKKHRWQSSPAKPTNTTTNNTMKFFNAIQIALLIVAGPILIPLLKGATFFAATPLMWVLAAVWLGLFIWNIFMIHDSLAN